jgi:deoxyribodipyrimidine photo-lyase
VKKDILSHNYDKALVWFRRDLRDFDHAALYYALTTSSQVYCVFIFDTDILDQLQDKNDRRVEFIWHSIVALKASLQAKGGDLIIRYGSAKVEIPKLALALNTQALFFNHDDEPTSIARDRYVEQALAQHAIATHHFKDHVVFERAEILTQSNQPYSVFTPYKNKWLQTINSHDLAEYPVTEHLHKLARPNVQLNISESVISLAEMGFKITNLTQLALPTGMQGGLKLFDVFKNRMHHYKDARNFPAVKGVSYLSVHLRFGTVSIRMLAREAISINNEGAQTWLNELIWRDFYAQILYHNPKIADGEAYKPALNQLSFPNNTNHFQAWCDGQTGFPLVDAAMRQLNQTGYMHNRLRMVVASFLVKDLLIDWRWGEQYFAEKLIDFDFASNNGGWQWAASTGCDAQPWFRIFNPTTQSEKFDAQGKFIRRYLPELAQCTDKEIHAPWLIPPARLDKIGLDLGVHYPDPIVTHAIQRESVLAIYKSALK